MSNKLVGSHVLTFQLPHSSMGDLKARIKAKLLRRHSATPSLASSRHSSKSERPPSSNTNKYAASSIHTSHDAGDDGDHKGSSIIVERDAAASSMRSRTNGTSGHQLPSSANHAGKSRPSTAASSTRNADQTRTWTATMEPASPEAQESQDSESLQQAQEQQMMSSTTAGRPDGAPEVGGAGGQGPEALPAASSNVNNKTASTCDTTKKTTTTTSSSSLSGNDQHPDAAAGLATNPTSPSSIPAANPLPSIHETSPTPDTIASPATDPVDTNPVAAALPKLAPPPAAAVALDAGGAKPPTTPTTPSVSRKPPLALNSNSFADAASIDFATPTSPSIISNYPGNSPVSNRPGVARRQSILPNQQRVLIRTLLDSTHAHDLEPEHLLPISATMVTRKIWVKRPGASATMITINEDDLVDDVRDLILRKYANSLGRQFDSPDLTIRIAPRDQNPRQLQPDEPMGRTLDAYFPGGQTVDDALLIDIPPRRTPKASPNPRYYGEDTTRPHESGTDYFPPYITTAPHSHHSNGGTAPTATLHFPSSMAIVNNGQLPPLPSPGGTRRLGSSRPKMTRLHTASPVPTVSSHVQHTQHAPVPVPTSIGTLTYSSRPQRSRTHSGASSDHTNHAAPPHPPPTAPAIPTPPIPERVATPPPKVASPRPVPRPKKKRTIDTPTLPAGMLNGSVPPINVLIVEDNIINLKLLEAFVKRLKVRWQTAMNGRDAVNKWRTGGFHLVLMDIQLPIMNGLDATREIRRIEKVNSIGVFSSSAASAPGEVPELDEKDKLPNTEMFKSPVIIVALTASSLQSDRHEALAAGCNDFLTKPVNFVWLERKVMEWGCMQALIDFDGWRKWKDYSQKAGQDDSVKKALAAKFKSKKNRQSLTSATANTAAA